MRRPPRTTIAALLLLPLLGVACGGGDDEGGESAGSAEPGSVSVVDNKFEPADIEVAPGDTVTWVWEGAVNHNVKGEGFESPTQKDGEYERQFNSAGEYAYVCTLHPGMKGKVVVG